MRAYGNPNSASASPDQGEAAGLASEGFSGHTSPGCYYRSTSVDYVEPTISLARGEGMDTVARRLRALR
jgi:hypothetical protein